MIRFSVHFSSHHKSCSLSFYKDDILDSIARYNPYENEIALALIQGGVSGLLTHAKKRGVEIDTSGIAWTSLGLAFCCGAFFHKTLTS